MRTWLARIAIGFVVGLVLAMGMVAWQAWAGEDVPGLTGFTQLAGWVGYVLVDWYRSRQEAGPGTYGADGGSAAERHDWTKHQ